MFARRFLLPLLLGLLIDLRLRNACIADPHEGTHGQREDDDSAKSTHDGISHCGHLLDCYLLVPKAHLKTPLREVVLLLSYWLEGDYNILPAAIRLTRSREARTKEQTKTSPAASITLWSWMDDRAHRHDP